MSSTEAEPPALQPSRLQIATPQFQVLPLAKLSDEMRSDWQAIRSRQPIFRSPFFSPDFLDRVARLMPNVEVVVAGRDGRHEAFLPFQRVGKDRGRPVAAGINDAHAVVAADELQNSQVIRIEELLAAAGLTQFHFHAAPPSALGVKSYEVGRTRAFLADLNSEPDGYESFLRRRNSTIDRQGQKTRKLERTEGKLRFEFDCRNPQMLSRVLELKTQQYRRTHTFDIFSVEWIQRLLFELHEDHESSVRGILSVLFAGEQPVALHFGMQEGNLLHYWFPVFDMAYSYGSPGTELFLEVVRNARMHGVDYVDMGYGEQAYKHKLTNVITEMSYGVVDTSVLRRAVFRSQDYFRRTLKKMPFREQLKPFVRRLVPNHGQAAYSEE